MLYEFVVRCDDWLEILTSEIGPFVVMHPFVNGPLIHTHRGIRVAKGRLAARDQGLLVRFSPGLRGISCLAIQCPNASQYWRQQLAQIVIAVRSECRRRAQLLGEQARDGFEVITERTGFL